MKVPLILANNYDHLYTNTFPSLQFRLHMRTNPTRSVVKMADLRDERVLRSTYLNMLFDWDGSDTAKVHEPLSQQFGYL